VSTPLLSLEEENHAPEAMTNEFFTQKFKTLWCPIGAPHDWQGCMYAHTYQDVRRPPALGYGHQLCPYWNKKDTNLSYTQRCPLGPRCPYAHGAKEQLYHPNYFRTLICRDLQKRQCPRALLCAFYHRPADCRKSKQADSVDYSVPLSKEAIPKNWQRTFLNPPRFQENSADTGPEGGHAIPQLGFDAGANHKASMYPSRIQETSTSESTNDCDDSIEGLEDSSQDQDDPGAATFANFLLAMHGQPARLPQMAEDAEVWAGLPFGGKATSGWEASSPFSYPGFPGNVQGFNPALSFATPGGSSALAAQLYMQTLQASLDRAVLNPLTRKGHRGA